MFRLILAVLFLGIYQRYGGITENKELLTGILILSGITDFLDGKIARKFHMVSEIGKLLDPIADKVTQGVLLICLFSEYNLTKGVFTLFLVKEGYMAVMGTRTVMKVKKNEGAKWYGKLSTTVFYTVMVVLIFFHNISESTANMLILCCGGCVLLAFIMYARHYQTLSRSARLEEACLATKIFPGHVRELIGKCDDILIPRISNFGLQQSICTKFEALYDMTANMFRNNF